MQKDFSYKLKIEDLTQKTKHYHLEADSKEREILKKILKTEDVKSFVADIDLKLNYKTHRLDIKGTVDAVLSLKSVISLEVFDKEYEASFEYYYDTSMTYDDIKSLDAGIEDEIPEIVENGEIDLGQIAIEQLALVMDDYPRMEGEVFTFKSEFDEKTTKAAHPFAVLEKLKK